MPATKTMESAPDPTTCVWLTAREIEVVATWLRSESKASAAHALFIAESTVAVHIARVRAKYAAIGRPANTKTALAAHLLRDGRIRLDDLY